MTRARPLASGLAQRRSARSSVPIPWREAKAALPLPPGEHRIFMAGQLRLIVSLEPIGWHLSISHPRRYPTWDEIADARYRFIPDEVTMAMLLPPRGEYVNVHETCMHLHQVAFAPSPGAGGGTLEAAQSDGVGS